MKLITVRPTFLERIALTLLITIARVAMYDLCENHCESSPDASEALPAGVVNPSALALVPYDKRTLTVPDFHLDERRLQFAEFTVTLSQNWHKVGVAAVVWEAVSQGYA